ncbi:hypothetical protein HWV62_28517 [Athelia sp. TMB]|nr:hypothetical protein HWV62_28517 [Athelia sp. TMB]
MAAKLFQKALTLPAAFAQLTLESIPVPTPGPGAILVRNAAVGLNPSDWKLQKSPMGKAFLTFPGAVLGLDFAGVVESVGEGVTTFKKGDRVVAQGNWSDSKTGAFQQYSIATAQYTTKIPENISFDAAATLPLTLMTAATGLYQKGALGAGLRAPWEENGRGHYKGTSILIIAGGSCVGGYAIQLAKMSGFGPIYTTASLKHTEYLTTLGATHVLDRAQPIPESLSFPVIFDAVSTPDVQRAAAAALAPGGTLVLMRAPPEDFAQALKEGALTKVVFGSPFHPANTATGEGVFGNLEKWLEDGDIMPSRFEVVPGGLGGIVGGLEKLEKGEVSGCKLVVRPGEVA